MMTGFGFIGFFLMLIFWVGLIALAVWLVKALFGNNNPISRPPTMDRPSARDILDQRYARGEITREQYELMKQDIS